MSNESESKPPRTQSKGRDRGADDFDNLIANKIFPDASAVFTNRPISLKDAKDTACVVLDTNALLVPYGIEKQTLSQIEATYRRLIGEKRLLIPAQVAREFARNRVTKLSELHQRLSRRRNLGQPLHQGASPLLEHLPDYKRLLEVEREVDVLQMESRKLLGSIIDHVRSWEWNDPVSDVYRHLFTASSVIEPTRSETEIRTEHARRLLHKIPPGYKDEQKDDDGIGDFLIWLSILEIGTKHKKSLFFVSGEEKADWWHRSENRALYPRFELVDEYRRASEGHSFHIIKFSELLELFGANSAAVAEVEKEERSVGSAPPLSKHSAVRLQHILAEQAVGEWLTRAGYSVCAAERRIGYDFIAEDASRKFYVDVLYDHGQGAFAHRMRSRHMQVRDRRTREPELASMPVVFVVVADTADALAQADHAWSKLEPIAQLCTGLLTPDGTFQVVTKPF